ncbi:hypothetical protein TrLO_g11182 [Triparma laevis f. longispina]|uniref:Transmembrane protein n=1 Tax=Triparma laevis f. longispina TaxID=1714387 RepID=A0A9W7KTA7_9STRA|nr:hypothetical protein TrLO_g11182 [Triparma laevis f. longispina]
MAFFTSSRCSLLLLLALFALSNVSAFRVAPPVVKHYQKRSLTQLRSSNSNDDDTTPLIVPEIVLDEGAEVVRARESQSSFYRTATWLYGATTFDSLSCAARIGGTPATAMATSVPSAALALAAVSVHTLKSASDSSRLNSDTYKRLNLSLMAYSLFNVVSGLASFKTLTPMKSSQCAVHVYSVFVCLTGWLKGARGLNPEASASAPTIASLAASELFTGFKNTLSTLSTASKSLSSLPYTLGAAGAFLMFLHDVILMGVQANKAALPAAKVVTRCASAAISSIFFGTLVTLADACNRKRNNGTTFVYLNGAASLSAMSVLLASLLNSASLNGRVKATAALAFSVCAVAFNNCRKNLPEEFWEGKKNAS